MLVISVSWLIDAGKTTTTSERILFHTGKTTKSVRYTRAALMDWMVQNGSASRLPLAATTIAQRLQNSQQYRISLVVDTPGHVDFTVEVNCAMLDGACRPVLCRRQRETPQSGEPAPWRQATRHAPSQHRWVTRWTVRAPTLSGRLRADQKRFEQALAPAVVLPIGAEDKFEGLMKTLCLYNLYLLLTRKGGVRDNFTVEGDSRVDEEAASGAANSSAREISTMMR